MVMFVWKQEDADCESKLVTRISDVKESCGKITVGHVNTFSVNLTLCILLLTEFVYKNN